MDENRENLKRLERELWNLLLHDGGGEIEQLRAIKTREDRRGRMKLLLCRAIRESSLGTFAGKFYCFGGKTYVPIEKLAFYNILFQLCSERIQVPAADLVHMTDIYQDCANVVYAKHIVLSNGVMIFHNGVLDVEKGKFYRTFDSRYVHFWSVDYDYEAGVKTFLWQKFLDQVLPDKYWQDALQMFLGATFVDRRKVKIEHIVILLGKGANGKSVIQQAVCGVLGQDYVSTMEVGRLCSRSTDGDMAVADVNGRRLNYCTEMEETDFMRKSARLKAIVSGEAVTARQLYGIPFKATNIPLLMANANHLPFFNTKDEAMMRRIYVIPFNVTIPEEEQDRELSDKLVDEYPAILNWILEGRQKFIENGYRLPRDTSIARFIEEKENEFNSVMKFMSMHKYLPSPEGQHLEPIVWRTANELYSDYERWCKQNYVTDIQKKVTFRDMLINKGYHYERKSRGMSFALYGNAKSRIKKMKDNMKQLDKTDPKLTWIDGVGYASTMVQLVKYTSVSRHVLNRVKGDGYLNDCIRMYEGRTLYNVAAVMEVLRRMRIIATDEEKEYDKKMATQMHKERNRFNARMKARGWPYRKYDTDYEHLDDGIVVVPDDTTDDECMEMARDAGYDTDGLYGQGYTILKNRNNNEQQEESGEDNEVDAGGQL